MNDGFVVDMHITGRCNMKCPFCCGTMIPGAGPSPHEFIEVVDRLCRLGCKTLVFTGGEPLLRPDIGELLRLAKMKGLETYLSTNGLLLKERYDELKDNVDCIGLPLDGSSPEVLRKMGRDPQAFKCVLSFLDHFRAYNPVHKVRVGAVVSKVNYDDIPAIADLLFKKKRYRIDTYRLYQFSALGRGLINQQLYYISNLDFDRLVKWMKILNPMENIKPLSNDDSNNAYVFINPDLDIEVLQDGQYCIVGNMINSEMDVLQDIFQRRIMTLIRGKKNRRWLKE